MITETEKIIKERVNKLPSGVLIAIKSISLEEKMKVVAKNNNLNEEQEELFATETTLVILGIESPEKYPDNLADNVGLDDKTVVKIAKEVDEQILTPILEMVEKNKKIISQKPNSEKSYGNTQNISTGVKERVIEIAVKYGLDKNQENALVTLALSVISNPEEKGLLQNNISQTLKISGLMAEQIVSDLEKRVFSQQVKLEKIPDKKPTENKPVETKIPEVKPTNLPMVEKNEVAHDVKKDSSEGSVASSKENTTEPDMSKRHFDIEQTPPPVPKPVMPAPVYKPDIPEPVQRPFSVPRIIPVVEQSSLRDTVTMPKEEEMTKPQSPMTNEDAKPVQNMMNDKMTKVTTGMSEKPKPDEPPKKYSADPYREPLE